MSVGGISYARLLGEVVLRNAEQFGEKPALISASGQQTSFRTFATRVRHLVGGLRALGLKEGSRVAILSRNRPEFVEAICAAAGGFIAVPLNWRLSQEEIALILRDCQPDALLELAEAPLSQKGVADDEKRPPVADRIQRPRDRAIVAFKAGSFHHRDLRESYLTRFLQANRYPPRIKSGAGFRSKTLR